MINTPEFYKGAGQEVSRAVRQGDYSRAKHAMTHFDRAKRLESQDDRRAAEMLYKEGYQAYK